MKINTTRASGFTLVEIMIVVAIIGLLAAIAIPNFVRARAASQANACINNMRQVDGAVQQYSLEKGKKTGDTVTVTEVKEYLKLTSAGKVPGCPSQGTAADGETDYTAAALGTVPSVTCVNAAADPKAPHVMP